MVAYSQPSVRFDWLTLERTFEAFHRGQSVRIYPLNVNLPRRLYAAVPKDCLDRPCRPPQGDVGLLLARAETRTTHATGVCSQRESAGSHALRGYRDLAPCLWSLGRPARKIGSLGVYPEVRRCGPTAWYYPRQIGEVNMGAAELHQHIAELEEQVNNLSRAKRELEEKVEQLTPRKMFTSTLNSDKPPYWIEG
jgi:hypothetical protein